MGKFWDLIQQHMDDQRYTPSERKVAKQLGVTPSTLSNWRDVKQLITAEHIQAVAELTGAPYGKVLDALLEDIGYWPPPGQQQGRYSA